MSGLILDVRLDGYAEPIGKLTRSKSGNVAFAYSKKHLATTNALPLSLSFPLSDEPYGDVATRSFFSNLLQERDQPIREIMEKYGLESADVAGLLFYMGADCAGAVSILPEGAPPTKVPGNLATDYDVLSSAQLELIVKALHDRRPLPNELRDPSPLAGVQSKLSVLLLENEQFALPKPGTGAPTTHVMKVPDLNHKADSQLENLSLQLSDQCGMTSVPSAQFEIAGISVLITTRFDRDHNARGQIVRLHQEDFAQALSLPPSLKYERRGVEGRIFNAKAIGKLLNETANPDIGRNSILKLTLFDLLVGNVDGHAKNHALLYGQGTRPELAPRYDILPTRLDDSFTEELSYSIGTAKVLADVDQTQFSKFLSDIGIARPAAQKRLVKSALDQIVTVLAAQLEALSRINQKPFADLIAANMRELLPKLGYPVPIQAKERDAHVVRGGGWLMS